MQADFHDSTPAASNHRPPSVSVPRAGTSRRHIDRPKRRTVADRLRMALTDLADGHEQVISHRETPWASITYAGSRHTMTVSFTGAAAVEAGETVIAQLPDHEFTIPGQVVIEATVRAVDHQLFPEPRIVMTAELLLLADA